MVDRGKQTSDKRVKVNKIVFVVEIVLTIAICTCILVLGISSLKTSAVRVADAVDDDYELLMDGYITTFNNLVVMIEEKIKQDYTFDEMLTWLQSKEIALQESIGTDVYDGIAFSYKGGYVRSWSYGDYTNYDPTTRPWYQRAEEGRGETVVVAPYVTFLDPSYLNSDQYILMTIAKKYNQDITFDYDIKIMEIQKLLSEREYAYDGTRVLLFDEDGYILSSNDKKEFGHNVFQADDVISEEISRTVATCETKPGQLFVEKLDGTWEILYATKDSRGNTFLLMYPLWEVFQHNFLAVIAIAVLLILLSIYLYKNNTKGILEFQRKETQLYGVLDAAFEKQLYVDLEDMSFSGNSSFEQMTGTRDYEAAYHSLLYLMPDEESRKRMDAFLSPEVVKQETEFSGEMVSQRFTFRHLSQTEESKLVVLEIFRMFSKSSGNKVMILLSNDVTEDAAILKKALVDAETANRAKTDFLSRMSHDIRTPMNAIIGMTHLAKNEQNPSIIQEYLDNIDSSSQFLLGLINDILDLSKIESGELALRPEACTREDFEKSVNTVIRPLMESRNISFEVRLSSCTDCIWADKLRFYQIFFNLLSNAAKFTKEGGHVSFIAERLPEKNGVYGARYTIKDDGIGMSQAFLERIFEPFSQEKKTDSPQTVGTGLGLPIVKSLVDAMDGTIQVKSEENAGTEFIVDLYTPVATKEYREAVTETDGALLQGKQILLAEDNNMNILVATKLLEHEGCEVTVAKNGKEAVDLFEASAEGGFDAILMDVRMPVMDGIEATKTIRKLNRMDGAKVPIIAMTADAFTEEQKKTLDAGMNYHLSKPIDPKLLYKVLRQYIGAREL